MGCTVTRPQELVNGHKIGDNANGLNSAPAPKNGRATKVDDEDLDTVMAGSKGILDPRLPLNRREIFLLNKSWKGISRNMDLAGVKMFTKIFMANPELLAIFTNIKLDKSQTHKPQDYENSMELETHGEIVMNTLDEAIICFSDYDKCHQILTSIGSYHATIKGFKGEYFYTAEQPFLEALEEVLGDRFTPSMKSIYEVAIKFILTTLCQGFDLGRSQNIYPK